MNRVAALKTHQLPDTAFTALAAGGGDSAVIRLLREAQQSKHTMLLHAIAKAAGDADPADPGIAAFRVGYDLLTRIQMADPGACTWLLSLPHLGGWAHDGLIRLDQGTPPDFAYLACAAASGAVRAGVPFELDVPVRDGCVLLPGLGRLDVGGEPAWVRLRYDGEQLAAGDGVSRLPARPGTGLRVGPAGPELARDARGPRAGGRPRVGRPAGDGRPVPGSLHAPDVHRAGR